LMPTALVGNDKGDRRGLKSRGELDGHAEKHGMSTVRLSIDSSHAQVRQESKMPCRIRTGSGAQAPKGMRSSALPASRCWHGCSKGRRRKHPGPTGTEDSIVLSRRENERGVSELIRAMAAACGRDRNENEPKFADSASHPCALRGRMATTATASGIGNCWTEPGCPMKLLATEQEHKFPLDMNGSHVETRDWD